jgi:sigma-E factor negative regulatory protein RseC
MSAKSDITHPGIVDSTENGTIHVKILSQSACSTCHAKGMCSIAEMEEKIVDIPDIYDGKYNSGDNVTITMKKSLGAKAVLLGYILPFLIVLIALIAILTVTGNEGVAALISIGLLVPYYLLLYYFKDKLSREFTFHIED